VAVLFGLLTFLLPGITLATLVLLFGAYALVDGFFNVLAFFKDAAHHWDNCRRVYVRVTNHHRNRVALPNRILGDFHWDL
jgi:uncharacterized membrane protein HdeD (DUF308 family)